MLMAILRSNVIMQQNWIKHTKSVFLVFGAICANLVLAIDADKPAKTEISAFTQSTANTIYTAKVLTELNSLVNAQVEKKTVELINNDLYGTNLSGEPAIADVDSAFLQKHATSFCSPLSGHELTMFKACNVNTPLILQHADIKSPLFEHSKLHSDLIPIAENWIKNFGASPVSTEIPEYVYNPTLLTNHNNQKNYVERLRHEMWGAIRAESLSRMLARRIPADPKDKNSPSIASAMEQEVNGRYLNPKWQDDVSKASSQLDLAKEQLRVLSLISTQIHELNDRVERIEMLETGIMTLLANQQEQISSIAKRWHK